MSFDRSDRSRRIVRVHLSEAEYDRYENLLRVMRRTHEDLTTPREQSVEALWKVVVQKRERAQ